VAYLPPGVSAKDVRIYLSDPPVSTDPITTLTLTPDNQWMTLCIPGEEIPSERPITLTFKAGRSYSPSQLNPLGDSRVLDFSLSEFTVDAASCDDSRRYMARNRDRVARGEVFLRIKIRSVRPIAAPERPIAVCCHGHTFAPF
jgi:hypothetical protein